MISVLHDHFSLNQTGERSSLVIFDRSDQMQSEPVAQVGILLEQGCNGRAQRTDVHSDVRPSKASGMDNVERLVLQEF